MFRFQARSANDSMSVLTMVMNPDRAKDLNDMMNKLDRWDALIRDYEMKFEKDDISDKMRQAALFAMAPEAVVENRLAGRRDLDSYAKVRCMIDDMMRDKREARGAIKLSGRGGQPPPDVPQLKLREMTDFAEGIGHPARLCPSEGWVNDSEQDAPEGEDTNEEGCWTEEDDETLQKQESASRPSWISSPSRTSTSGRADHMVTGMGKHLDAKNTIRQINFKRDAARKSMTASTTGTSATKPSGRR